jgi:large conductance mechanosensitive channel
MARRRATGFLRDFQEFINRGNVVDLAVAVVLGTAFGRIVTSFVEDIITPAILNPAIEAAGVENLSGLVIPGTAIKYGSFLAAILNFLIISLAIFIVVQAYEAAKRRFAREEAADPEVPPDAQQQLADAANRLAAALETRRL